MEGLNGLMRQLFVQSFSLPRVYIFHTVHCQCEADSSCPIHIFREKQKLWERWILQRQSLNTIRIMCDHVMKIPRIWYCCSPYDHRLVDLIDINVSGWYRDTDCRTNQRKTELQNKCDHFIWTKMTRSQSIQNLKKNSNNFVRVNVQNSSWRPPGPGERRKQGSRGRLSVVLMTSVLGWQLLASLPISVVCESSAGGRFQSLEWLQPDVV